MAQFILVRHGETEANRKGCYAQSPEDPLTNRGIDQVRQAAAHISKVLMTRIVVANPLVRARQSGEIIAQALGVPLEIVEGLEEQNFGNLSGQPVHSFAANARSPRWLWRPTGGESSEDVCRRVVPVLERLCARYVNDDYVVVSHAAVMRSVWMHLSGHLERWDYGHSPDNGSMILITHRSGRMTIPSLLNISATAVITRNPGKEPTPPYDYP